MMVEGPVQIILSYKEVDKHCIWMRPYLDKEGYEFLYFGARGWTPFECCCDKHRLPEQPKEIPGYTDRNDGGLFEITSPDISCGCD